MSNVNVTVVVIHNNQYQQRQQEQAKSKPIVHHKTPDGLPGIQFEGRRCTDPLMCGLFVMWIFLMLGISAFSFNKGELDKVALKFDLDLKDCDKEYPMKLFTKLNELTVEKATEVVKDGKEIAEKKDLDSAKKLLDTVTKDIHYSVCIKKCPKIGEKVEFRPNSVYKKGNKMLSKWTQYETQDVMGFCLPDAEFIKTRATQLAKAMSDAMGNFARYTNDVIISYPLVCIMAFVSLLITVAYLYLLKCITKPILYTSLFLVFILGCLITAWCFKKA